MIRKNTNKQFDKIPNIEPVENPIQNTESTTSYERYFSDIISEFKAINNENEKILSDIKLNKNTSNITKKNQNTIKTNNDTVNTINSNINYDISFEDIVNGN